VSSVAAHQQPSTAAGTNAIANAVEVLRNASAGNMIRLRCSKALQFSECERGSVLEDETRAILKGRLESALTGLRDPPANNPDAFDAITLALDMRAVTTRQHPAPPPWMTAVSLDSKLLEVASVLPLAAQHSPANVRALSERTFHVIKSDLTLAEEERVNEEFVRRLRAGQSELYPGEPLLDLLFAALRLTDDQFPHGFLGSSLDRVDLR
jgi:hypothetical protein